MIRLYNSGASIRIRRDRESLTKEPCVFPTVWWVAFSKGLVPPRVGVAGQDGLIHLIEFPKLETMFGNPDALLTEARRRAGLEVCEVNNRPVLVPIFPSQQGRIC
jgi:hypothetical protein